MTVEFGQNRSCPNLMLCKCVTLSQRNLSAHIVIPGSAGDQIVALKNVLIVHPLILHFFVVELLCSLQSISFFSNIFKKQNNIWFLMMWYLQENLSHFECFPSERTWLGNCLCWLFIRHLTWSVVCIDHDFVPCRDTVTFRGCSYFSVQCKGFFDYR